MSTPEQQTTAPLIVLGDLLKSEADRNSRLALNVAKGVRIGQLVEYAPRKQYLIALSDETDGKVLIQPHNCVIDLAPLADTLATELTDAGLNLADWMAQGDAYGIKYIGQEYLGSKHVATDPLPDADDEEKLD